MRYLSCDGTKGLLPGFGAGHSSAAKAMAILVALAMSLAAFALCAAGTSDADGKTVTVNTWDELQNALKNCESDDTIILGSDIELNQDSDEEEIEGINSLRIDLGGHTIKANHFKDSVHQGRLFHIGESSVVTIENGTLSKGFDDDGGCAYVESTGTLVMRNVNITDCGSSDDGAAIFVNGGILEMHACSISDCRSYDNGGAIYVNDGGHAILESVQIQENKADGHGGAIEITESSGLEIEGCTFEHNYCTDEGGAVFINGESGASFVKTTFVDNGTFQGDHGGAIYIAGDSSATISSCTFQDNECGADGGAIYITDSSMDIGLHDTVNYFKGNLSWESGGAIYIKNSNVSIAHANFEDNGAGQFSSEDDAEGGAMFIDDDSEVYLEVCSFTGNKARTHGGGIVVEDDDDISLRISDLIVIKDNKIATHDETFSDSNLVIRSDLRIDCGTLADGSEIWVALDGGERVFTSNFSTNNPDKDPATFFKSTDTNRYVAADPDSKEARLYGGSAEDMSDNTMLIVGIAAAIVVILAAVGAFYFRRAKKI
jgi:predicted outer membrane repeat protein